MRRIAAISVVALLVGCNPAPVDENAVFTIQGRLVKADGTPGAQQTVKVFKVDSWFSREKHILLDYPSVDDFANDHDVNADAYDTQSDASGNFKMELTGAKVNRRDGSGAAYLVVVYELGEDLVTITPWYNFRNEDPIWNVGDLKLWDGGTASVIGSEVVFDAGTGAPTGHTWDSGEPLFVFSYVPGLSGDYVLEWAAHGYTTKLSVPRKAYLSATPPGFVMMASSKLGSQTYKHRTSFKNVTAPNWIAPNNGCRIKDGLATVRFLDSSGTTLDKAAIADNDSLKSYDFVGVQPRSFYVDLGAPVSFTEILVKNLVVSPNLNGVTVELSVSAENVSTTPTAGWTVKATNGPGTYDLQNWLYLGWTGTETARWIQVRLLPVTGTATFESVGEIEVLY